MDDIAGHRVLRIPPGSLWDTVDLLLQQVGPNELRGLNFRAGEHLAVILSTAFLGAVPTGIDISGGPDIVFNTSEISTFFEGHVTKRPIAFEIKSLPGPFRQFEYRLNRLDPRSAPTTEIQVSVTVSSVDDVLDVALPKIERARQQLESKAPHYSQNAFIVAHMLDHFPREFLSSAVYGPHLRPLGTIGELETVWILWDPYRLTVWSSTTRDWLNLLFSAVEENESPDPRISGEFDVLQEVELYFLNAIGEINPSPYVFGLTSEGQ